MRLKVRNREDEEKDKDKRTSRENEKAIKGAHGQERQAAAVNVLVDRPLDVCWATLSDLSVPHYYVPGLTGTVIVSPRTRGEGARRRSAT